LTTAKNVEPSYIDTKTNSIRTTCFRKPYKEKLRNFKLGYAPLLSTFEIFPVFTFMFVIVFIIVILSMIINFYRALRRPAQSPSEEPATIVKEREIIREIVKIRCPYCNNLYDEKYDKCPHCGGKRKP